MSDTETSSDDNIESDVVVGLLRILIVGGYGVFGGRLAELLADDARVELVIAGRSLAKADTFCATLSGAASKRAARFDRDGDVAVQLAAIEPHIIVDASGPFQNYGQVDGVDPYRVVRAAIGARVHYMDLADGSDFVAGIAAFDLEAKQAGVFVLSGVSSFPVLTVAVVRQLSVGMRAVETITGGIAPSPYAGVGLNVIKAIASYAGKPVGLTRDGALATGYGLVETMRATIAPPGRLPLRSTLFSLVDVPDLRMVPPLWPGLRSIWMGAGPVPEVWHRGLWALAWLVRLRVLPSLTMFARLFCRVIAVARWGEHRGGMFVCVGGVGAEGGAVTRTWHLLAEGADGPYIPSMAVVAVVRRYLGAQVPMAGARAAVADLEVADYEALFASRTIYYGVREESAAAAVLPLYQRVLGEAWAELPAPLQRLHAGGARYNGRASVERGGGALSRLIGRVFGFPEAADDVPVEVRFERHGQRETWTRTFAGQAFSSVQSVGTGRSDALIDERFGPLVFGLALVVTGERLDVVVRRWRAFGVPMPLWLAPGGRAFEFADANGRFNFDVEIGVPGIGRIVRYRGFLVAAQ